MEEDVEEIVGVRKIGVPVPAEHHPMPRLLQRTSRLGRRVAADVDLDADRREIFDDQRQQAGVVELVRVPGSVVDTESGGIASLAHQRASQIGIVFDAAQAGLVSEEAGREEGAGDDTESAENALVDAIAIDGVTDRPPHFRAIERRSRAVVSEVRSMQLRRVEHVRRVARIMLPLAGNPGRDAVGDVQLSACEGVGDIASAAQVQSKRQLVDVRLTGDVVLRIPAQADALSFDRLLHLERTRADGPLAEPLAIPSLLGGNDRRLVHRKQREKKGEGLVKRNIDRVSVVNGDTRELLRAAGLHIGGSANIAQDPAARRLQLRRQQAHEAVVHVARFERAAIVKTHAAAEMHPIAMALFQQLPRFRQSGHHLRPFAIRDQRGVDRARHESERGCGDIDGIEIQLLPEDRCRGDAAALIRTRQRESIQFLIEQRRFMRERVGHLIEIGDAHVRFARRLFDDAHGVDDRRALGAQDGDGLVDALHEAHDVLHGPPDGAAAGLLFRGGAFEMFRRVAHRGRLLADLA